MRKSIVQVGFRKGKLLVIEELEERYQEPNGRTRPMVLVRCDCGFEYKTITNYILGAENPNCVKCGNNKKRKYKIGDKFGDLTIISLGHNNNKRKDMALCKCVCGNIVPIRANYLKYIINTNCGKCQRPNIWKGTDYISGTAFGKIKRSAEIRNIQFEITIQEITELFIQQKNKCALSGLYIEFGKDTRDKNTASLDRKDSTKGYTIDNVQWVHKDINKIKMDFDQEKFIYLCKLVAKSFL